MNSGFRGHRRDTSRSFNFAALVLTCAALFSSVAHAADYQTLGSGESAWLLQLRQIEGRFRTNLSFANTGEAPAQVQLGLFDASGALVMSYELTLARHDMVQDLSPFSRKAHQPNLGWGFAEITVLSGNGILASASVVDSVTNDATTIPFRRAGNLQ